LKDHLAMAGLMNRISARISERLADTQTDESLIERTLTEITRALPHAHGRPLAAHLRGTREILRAWQQPMWIQLGGLFHSIYGTDDYRNSALAISQREDLRLLIGKRAERLAYLFAASRKQDIVASASASDLQTRQPPRLPDRFTGAHNLLTREELFALLVLLMANQAEQTAAKDSLPGNWLADLTAHRQLLDENAGVVPPVLQKLHFSREQETKLIAAYRSAMNNVGAGHLHTALRSLEEIEQAFPHLPESCLWRALIELQTENRAHSKRLAEEGASRLRSWGTAWDKRLTIHEWLRVARALEQPDMCAPDFLSSDPAYLLLWADRACGKTAICAGQAISARLSTFLQDITATKNPARLNVYPLPDGPAWYRASEFAIAKALEEAYPAIREEVLALDDLAFHSESERIRRTGSWQVCMLYERGRRDEENCRRCPTITRIVEAHDTVRTLAGLIYISRMAPQTHVAAHRGPTNMRLRCHLGIQVPEGDCAIRVGSETRKWTEGKCLVFDDFYEHEAWNHTAADRIVLIVDLWRPELTREEREFLTGLHNYVLLQAQSLHKYWTANADSQSAKRKGYD